MINRLILIAVTLLILLFFHYSPATTISSAKVLGVSPLSTCSHVFIDGKIEMAPTVYDSSTMQPYGNNRQFCYGNSLALEYWGGNHSPRWAAFVLPTKEKHNCARTEGLPDSRYPENTLKVDSYDNSGLVAAQLATSDLFKTNSCANYYSDVLTNISPQHKGLHSLWLALNKQISYWQSHSEELYIISGNGYNVFPSDKLHIFKEGTLNAGKLIPAGTSIEKYVAQSDPLIKLNKEIKDDVLPTAYFALIYRPETATTKQQLIGFLFPHSYQDISLIPDGIWAFQAPLTAIESTADVYFPGIKNLLGERVDVQDNWFIKHKL